MSFFWHFDIYWPVELSLSCKDNNTQFLLGCCCFFKMASNSSSIYAAKRVFFKLFAFVHENRRFNAMSLNTARRTLLTFCPQPKVITFPDHQTGKFVFYFPSDIKD